jgi:hypothetical protein
MPALDTRAGFVWCTFFHTVSRRNAVIHSSAQTCRRDQREDERCGRITDTLIAHCRTGVITRAASAAGDRRVCRLLLDTDAGHLEEIHTLISKIYWSRPGLSGNTARDSGVTNPNQSGAISISITQHTNKNRVQPSGSDLLAVADRRTLRDCSRVWYRRNQAFDVYCISVERDSIVALRRRNYRVCCFMRRPMVGACC